MFPPETLAEFGRRFPSLTPDRIRKAATWVERTHDASPFSNPGAVLESVLNRAVAEAATAPAADTPTAPGSGSLSRDGSWDAKLVLCSEAERAVIELARIAVRLDLSPAEAVSVVTASTVLSDQFRASTLTAMAGIDARPLPCPGGPYTTHDWLHGAWSCVTPSTSAEEITKRLVLRYLSEGVPGAA